MGFEFSCEDFGEIGSKINILKDKLGYESRNYGTSTITVRQMYDDICGIHDLFHLCAVAHPERDEK